MEILFLCGVFEKNNEDEIINKSKKAVEFSANIFQEKIIRGLKLNKYNFSVVSAPFIGSYPNASNILYFKGFNNQTKSYTYVHFNNIWGIRNLSRSKALKKAVNEFIKKVDSEKYIIVYSPHTPLIEAAVYAKKKDPNIKICLIVPDLPQYMNLSEKISWIYKIGKKFDIKKFNKLSTYVDSYVILTEHMKTPLKIGSRPYLVIEGLVDKEQLNDENSQETKNNRIKKIVYTGKLNFKFGIKELIEAFIEFEKDKYELILCGKGDSEDYINKKIKEGYKIKYLGQVSPNEAKKHMREADILINPRKGEEEFTKYSFPSKNIEYLLTGNEVVGYPLEGIPKEYTKYMHFIENNNVEQAIVEACSYKKNVDFILYAKNNLESSKVIKKIITILRAS